MNAINAGARIAGTVKQFPYRTARVDNAFITLRRTDEMDALQRELATAASVDFDNHVVFEITQSDGQPPVYIMFSDFHATFAHSVREGRW